MQGAVPVWGSTLTQGPVSSAGVFCLTLLVEAITSPCPRSGRENIDLTSPWEETLHNMMS